ncbi:hypothetical protein BC828DRAFT_392290 [Blastocladiella britannica]|nr:hypothetical protein BC828DRAFT_392290 [Blastocladiella britannica]
MENIPIILNRILLFAAHTSDSLTEGVALLQVLPRSSTPDTHRHVICRLANVYSIGFGGHLDVLRLLDDLLSGPDLKNIAKGAVVAGRVNVLDWLLTSNPEIATTSDSYFHLSTVVHFAVMHSRIEVLDWYAAHGLIRSSDVSKLITIATIFCRVPTLDWLRAYAIKNGFDYSRSPAYRTGGIRDELATARVAMLDWWKADFAARSDEPMFPLNEAFPTDLASRTDDGLLVVEWWRTYCAESGRNFSWPVLDYINVAIVVRHSSLSFFQWWWDVSVRQVGIQRATLPLFDFLNSACQHGKIEFIEWYWNLCAEPANEIEFPRDWRPRDHFTDPNVIQWWKAKIERGHADPAVFEVLSKTSLLEMVLAARDAGAANLG